MGAWRAAAIATELGFSVGGSLVGGIVIGLFLDRQLGTRPLFFLLGLIGGVLASFYLMYVIYRMQVQPSQAPQSPQARQSPQALQSPRSRQAPPPPAEPTSPSSLDEADSRGARQRQDGDTR